MTVIYDQGTLVDTLVFLRLAEVASFVTLYLPSPTLGIYIGRTYQKMTSKKLADIVRRAGFEVVVLADDKPTVIMDLVAREDGIVIDDVKLENKMKLAALVEPGLVPWNYRMQLATVQEQVSCFTRVVGL